MSSHETEQYHPPVESYLDLLLDKCYFLFFTAETIESYLQIESGNSVVEELSAQHITSCTPNELSCGGSGGCQVM